MKFEKHKSGSRLLLNTVKMIDYRAKTALAMIIKEFLHRDQDARPIIRELFKTEADIAPDNGAKILNVRVHRMATLRNDNAVKKLFEKLNETETFFPDTDMKLNYYLIERIGRKQILAILFSFKSGILKLEPRTNMWLQFGWLYLMNYKNSAANQI